MTFWQKAVGDFLARVRRGYPKDWKRKIDEGRKRFAQADVHGRFQAALGARCLLRVCSLYLFDQRAISETLSRPLQESEILFALDDLIRRYPDVIREDCPVDPNTDDPNAAILLQIQLQAFQYHAEMRQDVMVGIRDP